MDSNTTKNKPHRTKQSGPKAIKKLLKKEEAKATETPVENKSNLLKPKAVQELQSSKSMAKTQQRNLEREEKRLHVPMATVSPSSIPAPLIVAVVGPPKVGKTTLIKSLVKRYTKHELNKVTGLITVLSAKRQRLSFIECRNDINSMIDVGKVADLVILMINSKNGFEMETFEFLNVLQTHGFPKIIGVLTHLDLMKNIEQARTIKKRIKDRFWTEIYDGCKLFNLSGIISGRYPDSEIFNLSRFMSIMKLRPLIWKTNHPYILSDRITDMTSTTEISKNHKCNREIAFYGYLRGTYLKEKTFVHIPGAGDFQIDQVEVLDDPCPFPNKEKKRLSEKNKHIYAPYCDVGGISVDKDVVYVEKETESNKKSSGTGLNEEEKAQQIKLINELIKDNEEANDEDLKIFEDKEHNDILVTTDNQKTEESSLKKQSSNTLSQDAEPYNIARSENNELVNFVFNKKTFDKLSSTSVNDGLATLSNMLYGKSFVFSDLVGVYSKDYNRDTNHEKRFYSKAYTSLNYGNTHQSLQNECEKDDRFKDFFYTVIFKEENPDDNQIKDNFEEKSCDEDDTNIQINLKKKERLKKQFDLQYDNKATDPNENQKTYYDAQKEILNNQKLTTVEELKSIEKFDPSLKKSLIGVSPSSYVKIVIKNIPYELEQHYDPSYPIILGGLIQNEMNKGFIQTRIKRHRWFKKILKTDDPLIFSIGWRRYQSIPIYSTFDEKRNRMLKYTPEHMHCIATFYGFMVPANSGFLCVQTVGSEEKDFRICATGVITEIEKSPKIVKKLKLKGYPLKVYKNTAFIKDMFTSPQEIQKFMGASIRTVSGIRGQIKKEIPKLGDGVFRAAFEDKILTSDIVFLRTWVPVIPKEYCNSVTSLLSEDKKWEGMRNMYQLRKDYNLAIPVNQDSLYRPIERTEKVLKDLKISKKLEARLPYELKPKYNENKQPEKRAVILEPKEKQINKLLSQLKQIKRNKELKLKQIKEKEEQELEKKRKKEMELDSVHKKIRVKAQLIKMALHPEKYKK